MLTRTISETALRYLSELRPAPSVGLQDVPRESVGEHLGIGDAYEQGPLDDLDEQLAREYHRTSFMQYPHPTHLLPSAEHAKFVYNLQERAAHSDSDSDYDSDTSLARARTRGGSGPRSIRSGKKRMSLLTGEYYDVPRLGEGGNGHYDLGCGHEPWAAADLPSLGAKRRFFKSPERGDSRLERIMAERERAGVRNGRTNLSALMAAGGQDHASDPEELEMDVDTEEDG